MAERYRSVITKPWALWRRCANRGHPPQGLSRRYSVSQFLCFARAVPCCGCCVLCCEVEVSHSTPVGRIVFLSYIVYASLDFHSQTISNGLLLLFLSAASSSVFELKWYRTRRICCSEKTLGSGKVNGDFNGFYGWKSL